MVNINSDFSSDSSIPPELRAKVQQILNQPGSPSLEEMNKALERTANEYNHTPNPKIGGFTPDMLKTLFEHPMGTPGSPLKLSTQLTWDELQQAPYFLHIREMLSALEAAGKVKATPKGNFNRGFVAEMEDIFHDDHEKKMFALTSKVTNEADIHDLHIARLLCKLDNLIGITKGHYSLRKKALPLLSESQAGTLYQRLFLTYFTKLNIGYAIHFGPDLNWLQSEIGYMLKPLQDNGDSRLPVDCLCSLIFHPITLERLELELAGNQYYDLTDSLNNYLLNPLEQWGLLDIEYTGSGYSKKLKHIRKTPLFDRFIRFQLDQD